jgi:hypothetical protein
MTSSPRMLLTGIAFLVNTVVLVISAVFFDPVWSGLTYAIYGIKYSKAPVIDPGITVFIPGLYFGMLLCMWFALLYCVYMESIRREDYPYGGGGYS